MNIPIPIVLLTAAFVMALFSVSAILKQNRMKIGMELLQRFGKFDSQEFNNFKFSQENQYVLFHTNLQLDEVMSWFRQKFQGHFIQQYVYHGCDTDSLKGRFSVIVGGCSIPFELSMFHQPGAPDSICMVKPR
jgi:hypothetical protein